MIQIRDILPEDGERYRFNKIGEAIDVSHVQLTRYMSAAEYALQHALIVKLQRPEKSIKRYYARDELSLTASFWPRENLKLPDRLSFLVLESVEIGKPTPRWTEKGVVFELAHAPTKSKAAGRIMFFPHIGTNRKGILNAIANEAIPLRVTFPKPVKCVDLVLWGSTTSSALVEAFDAEDKLVTKDGVD